MKQKGFTLIELIVVIAIIGILAVVANSSYINYVVRANRTAAQSFMVELANRQKQYFLDARSYAANLTTLGVSVPREVAINYDPQDNFTFTITATPPGFVITAHPTSSRQSADGDLTLSSNGTKTPAEKW